MTCNPTLGYISREKHDPKGYIHPSVHCSIADNSQYLEANEVSIDRGVDKEDGVHVYNEILCRA